MNETTRLRRPLRTLRAAADLSQEELGRLVGVHADSIGRWERGVRTPAPDVLVRLLAVLGALEGKGQP